MSEINFCTDCRHNQGVGGYCTSVTALTKYIEACSNTARENEIKFVLKSKRADTYDVRRIAFDNALKCPAYEAVPRKNESPSWFSTLKEIIKDFTGL